MSEPSTGTESRPAPFRKGDELVVTPDRAAFNGRAVARIEGMVLFIAGCVPGDTVRVRVTKKRKSHGEARTLELLEPGPDRIDPPCSYFDDCGGCKWQNLAYESQLHWKRQHVVDAFERIADLESPDVAETVPAASPYWYRNKMEFSFGTERWLTEEEIASEGEIDRSFALGLHAAGRFDRVLDIERCMLQSEASNAVLNLTRTFALEHDLPAYTTRGHVGLLRNLVVRTSRATGEMMVILITNGLSSERVTEWGQRIRSGVPEVSTALHGLHTGKASVATAERIDVLFGPGSIEESIAGNRFEISPFSFFQTNPEQAQVLYERALEAARLESSERVWDLYCGAGTISLAAARRSGHVVGVELNDGAVADAQRAAQKNGVENVEFHAGDLKELIGTLGRGTGSDGEPDVVITDPPRSGMHEDVVRALLERRPSRIIYVSCNPTTQARDAAILAEHYRLESVVPVDMFPQTYHIETVARFELESG